MRKHPKQKATVTVGVLHSYTQENTFLLLFWWNRIQYPSAQTIQSWQYYLFLHAARLQETEQGTGRVRSFYLRPLIQQGIEKCTQL